MEWPFADEFAVFLHERGVLRFGDFELAGGAKSPFYIDLRLVPGYPAQFRRVVKGLQKAVMAGGGDGYKGGREAAAEDGLDRFDAWASVPTGGLVIAAALAVETLKPLVYARSSPKSHGTGKIVEGVITDGMKAVMVDDVATTGGSVTGGIRSLRDAGVGVDDAYVVVDRQEGAREALQREGVVLHSLVDITRITKVLLEKGMIAGETADRVIGSRVAGGTGASTDG